MLSFRSLHRRGGAEGAAAPFFLLVFSKCLTTNSTILLWKSFYKKLFNCIFQNVNFTLLRITNTLRMLYAACPEKESFHSGWGEKEGEGEGEGEGLGPLFLNFLDPPLVWHIWLKILWLSGGAAITSSGSLKACRKPLGQNLSDRMTLPKRDLAAEYCLKRRQCCSNFGLPWRRIPLRKPAL